MVSAMYHVEHGYGKLELRFQPFRLVDGPKALADTIAENGYERESLEQKLQVMRRTYDTTSWHELDGGHDRYLEVTFQANVHGDCHGWYAPRFEGRGWSPVVARLLTKLSETLGDMNTPAEVVAASGALTVAYVREYDGYGGIYRAVESLDMRTPQERAAVTSAQVLS
jgi:hypothetical protein